MGIRAIAFDCGGVLLRDGNLAAYRIWERRLGLPEGELDRQLWHSDAYRRAEIGQFTDAEFWLAAGQQLGLHDPQQVTALREDLWDTWVLNEEVVALVERARQLYKLAILSNATDALAELLETRYGVAHHFDVIISSACVGVVKPDPAIYEALWQRLDVQPGEVLFIDDRAENVAAAAALGMHVIWFVHAAELERQLGFYLNSKGNGHREADVPTPAVRRPG